MNIVRGNGQDWSDDDVQRALRAHLAPPSEASYWAQLEQRIVARVRTEGAREWWSWFPGWVRYGVVAAAAALLVAAITSWQVRTTQERVAYRELFDASSEVPVLSERVAPAHREREQTLQYLLTH